MDGLAALEILRASLTAEPSLRRKGLRHGQPTSS